MEGPAKECEICTRALNQELTELFLGVVVRAFEDEGKAVNQTLQLSCLNLNSI